MENSSLGGIKPSAQYETLVFQKLVGIRKGNGNAGLLRVFEHLTQNERKIVSCALQTICSSDGSKVGTFQEQDFISLYTKLEKNDLVTTTFLSRVRSVRDEFKSGDGIDFIKSERLMKDFNYAFDTIGLKKATVTINFDDAKKQEQARIAEERSQQLASKQKLPELSELTLDQKLEQQKKKEKADLNQAHRFERERIRREKEEKLKEPENEPKPIDPPSLPPRRGRVDLPVKKAEDLSEKRSSKENDTLMDGLSQKTLTPSLVETSRESPVISKRSSRELESPTEQKSGSPSEEFEPVKEELKVSNRNSKELSQSPTQAEPEIKQKRKSVEKEADKTQVKQEQIIEGKRASKKIEKEKVEAEPKKDKEEIVASTTKAEQPPPVVPEQPKIKRVRKRIANIEDASS